MKKISISLIFSLAHLRSEYDNGIERTPEMMTLLISRFVYVETKGRNTGKLQEVAEKDDIDATEFYIVLGGFCGAQFVVKFSDEFAIHHTHFIDEQVLAVRPLQHL